MAVAVAVVGEEVFHKGEEGGLPKVEGQGAHSELPRQGVTQGGVRCPLQRPVEQVLRGGAVVTVVVTVVVVVGEGGGGGCCARPGPYGKRKAECLGSAPITAGAGVETAAEVPLPLLLPLLLLLLFLHLCKDFYRGHLSGSGGRELKKGEGVPIITLQVQSPQRLHCEPSLKHLLPPIMPLCKQLSPVQLNPGKGAVLLLLLLLLQGELQHRVIHN